MKIILIFSIVISLTVADVHELLKGYQYNKPADSYGVPSYTVTENKYTTSLSGNGLGAGLTTGNGAVSGGFTTKNNEITGGFSVGSGDISSGLTTGSGGLTTNGGLTTGSGLPTGSGSYQLGNGGSIGLTTGSAGGFSNGFTTGSGSGFLSGGSSGQSGQHSNSGIYQNTGSGTTGIYNLGITGTGTSGNTGFSGQTGGYQTGSYQTGQYQTGSQGTSGYQTGGYQTTGQQSHNNYLTTSNGQSAGYQQNYNFIQSGPPQIFKHFYVHVAPEEPEPSKPQQPIVLPPKQKHYNIIFVKTPNPPVGSSHVIPIQQQSEEKTIVYVLSQNPEAINDVVLPKFTQKPPSKPEVFFIKYDGKDNAHGLINHIVNDYQSHGSVSLNGEGVTHNNQVFVDKFGPALNTGSLGQVTVDYDNAKGTSAANNYISSTESSSLGSNGIDSSTAGYEANGISSISTSSGLGGFGNSNEVNIGSNHISSTGSTSGQFGGSNLGGHGGYQNLKIETSSSRPISTTSNSGSFSFGTSSITPIGISTVGPSSTLSAIVTGNDLSSTIAPSLGGSSTISSGLSVPFETYGPPHFRPHK